MMTIRDIQTALGRNDLSEVTSYELFEAGLINILEVSTMSSPMNLSTLQGVPGFIIEDLHELVSRANNSELDCIWIPE